MGINLSFTKKVQGSSNYDVILFAGCVTSFSLQRTIWYQNGRSAVGSEMAFSVR